MAETRLRDDDVVLQKPEDGRVTIPVFHTSTACAGSAAAYLLRRIAYRAGAYAPGLHEHIFFELAQHSFVGGSIDSVERWFGTHIANLQELGYRVNARRVPVQTTEESETVLDWVKAGVGYRGALIPTTHKRIHPTENEDVAHAVGVTIDRLDPKRDEEMILVDPWPGTKIRASDRIAIPPSLALAHLDPRYSTIIFYWTGWA